MEGRIFQANDYHSCNYLLGWKEYVLNRRKKAIRLVCTDAN